MPWVGRVARGLVAHGGRFGALAGHALGAEAVDFKGGDAGLDKGGDVVQHFRGQTPRFAHAFDVVGGFVSDIHGGELSHLPWR